MNRLVQNLAQILPSALLLGATLALGGCATNGDSSSTDRSMMQPFQNYKAAWNSHAASTVAGYYGQSGTPTSPAAGASAVGR